MLVFSLSTFSGDGHLLTVSPSARSIVSAPLVIGMNLSESGNLMKHWNTITNTAAIEVNQDYVGHSGTIFDQSTAKTKFAPCGWCVTQCPGIRLLPILSANPC